jgi:hypothetical protein
VRPAADERGRDPAPDPPVHPDDQLHPRGESRRARPGREHRRPDHGLDDGRLLQPVRLHAGHRHRQAGRAGGVIGPGRGHRPRRRVLPGRGRRRSGHRPRWSHRGGPGIRQRGLVDGQADRGAGVQGGCGLRRSGRDPQRRRDRRPSGLRSHEGDRLGGGHARDRSHRQPGAARARGGRPDPRRARQGDHGRQRRSGAGPRARGGGQPSGLPGRRRHPPGQGRGGDPGHPGERWRRDGLLFRMGPEHPAVPVGRGSGQRRAQEDHVPGLEERPRPGYRGRHPAPAVRVRHRGGEGGPGSAAPRVRLGLLPLLLSAPTLVAATPLDPAGRAFAAPTMARL